jgi:hypothetical protein
MVSKRGTSWTEQTSALLAMKHSDDERRNLLQHVHTRNGRALGKYGPVTLYMICGQGGRKP